MIHEDQKSLLETKKFKEAIDKSKGEKFPLYTHAKDNLNWSPTDVMAFLEMGVITKKPFQGLGSKNTYTWEGEEPSMGLLKKVIATRKVIQNTRAKANKKKKKELKEAVAKEAEQKQLTKDKIDTAPIVDPKINSEKVVLDREEKAPIKPYVLPEEEAPIEKEKSSNIPISVEVVSEGNMKTVTIKITV